MFGWVNINTNVNGIAYLRTQSVTVGTDSVDFGLGFRRISPMGYLTINVADAIPADATGTLPVRFTLNGTPRNLTFFGGDNVTVADLEGTGVIEVFHDWYSGVLQLMSPLAPTA